MFKPKSFEKPMGFRDYPPRLADKKRQIENRVHTCFTQWGYQEIITPTLEFYETVGNASAISEQKMFKCMDRDGNTLVLRPDQTAPIARVVASILREESLPLRLCYHENVFRAQESEAGRRSEFYQSGVELIGLSSAESDAEVIALAIEALKACKIQNFRISIGHVGFVQAWMEERISEDETKIKLKEFFQQRNIVGFQQLIGELSLNPVVKEEMLSLLQVRNEPFDYFYNRTSSSVVQEALRHLQEVWSYLRDWDFDQYITFDPTLSGSLHYYTGLIFEGYAEASGFPLLSGGRYDHLLQRFGRDLPATGFALKIDRLMEATPLKDKPLKSVHIYYPIHLRSEAFQRARMLRQQGKTVILHVSQANNQQVVIQEEGGDNG